MPRALNCQATLLQNKLRRFIEPMHVAWIRSISGAAGHNPLRGCPVCRNDPQRRSAHSVGARAAVVECRDPAVETWLRARVSGSTLGFESKPTSGFSTKGIGLGRMLLNAVDRHPLEIVKMWAMTRTESWGLMKRPHESNQAARRVKSRPPG